MWDFLFAFTTEIPYIELRIRKNSEICGNKRNSREFVENFAKYRGNKVTSA
jgi:hypothetical protein